MRRARSAERVAIWHPISAKSNVAGVISVKELAIDAETVIYIQTSCGFAMAKIAPRENGLTFWTAAVSPARVVLWIVTYLRTALLEVASSAVRFGI